MPKFQVFQSYESHFTAEIKFSDLGTYKHVANVEAKDEEDAFFLMNVWPERSETAVERLTDRIHSLSVGDILVDENNRGRLCVEFGFEDLSPLWVALLD